jgi:hypothetical protein
MGCWTPANCNTFPGAGDIITTEGILVLSEFQIGRLWEDMLAAEARALYFGDLTSQYTRRKQWITGASFFFSSGAAATVIAKTPAWFPVVLSLAVAVVTAYSIAVNLDGAIKTMSALHSSWTQIATDYDRLWSHIYADDAEEQLYQIAERAREASELATTDAPNNQKLLGQWQDRVFALHKLTGQHG